MENVLAGTSVSQKAFVIGGLIGGLAGTARHALAADPGLPIAESRIWRERLIRLGTKNGEVLVDSTGPLAPLLNATSHDTQRVFYQIGDYLKENRWATYAERVMAIYRDRYVFAHKGTVRVPGLSARPGDALSPDQGREVTRSGRSPLDSCRRYKRVDYPGRGAQPSNRLQLDVPARSRIARREFPPSSRPPGEARLGPYRPVVRSAIGLIYTKVHDRIDRRGAHCIRHGAGDRRVPEVAQRAANGPWKLWFPKGAFPCVDRVIPSGGPCPAPALNTLIALAFAWLYWLTGITRDLEQADVTFVGGVRHADLPTVKLFSQNCFWSFDYLALRRSTRATR